MRLDRMEPARDVAGYVPYTAPWNLTGQPALSVPCGFDAGGLPIGLQLVGHHLDEATILRLGHAFQRATDWHCRRPPRGRVSEPCPARSTASESSTCRETRRGRSAR
jgi:Asp-tRNA(Asn)/Glu-tRNA(Gln) amidotransferase A subunit family amidase